MNKNFSGFGLASSLEESLRLMNFTTPTPIQVETLPITLAGHNLVGCAQTGSGKTLAYCLPIIQKLLEKPDQTALILAPTRELVMQIGSVFSSFLNRTPKLRKAELIGGQPVQQQIRVLKKKPFPRILIATPARLIDLIERNSVYLRSVRFLVLDEADRMLDMGFAPQLKRIEENLPDKHSRQTLMFSATMPESVDHLVSQFLCDEKRVTLGSLSGETHHIQQSAIVVDSGEKRKRLLTELSLRTGSIIVFSASKHRTDRLARFLDQRGHSVSRIHGGRTQVQRNQAMNNFRQGISRILVATDIAARGLDVPQVGTVINFDLPRAAEDYTHRIGRSGRAGNPGEALTFVTQEDRMHWKRIIKTCQLKLDSKQPQSGENPVERKPQSRDRSAKWGGQTQPSSKNHKKKSKRKDNLEKRRDSEQRGWPSDQGSFKPGLRVKRKKAFSRRGQRNQRRGREAS